MTPRDFRRPPVPGSVAAGPDDARRPPPIARRRGRVELVSPLLFGVFGSGQRRAALPPRIPRGRAVPRGTATMSEGSIADKIRDWETLCTNMEPVLADLPHAAA